MNCRRIQSLLSAYLDAELTGEEMLAIRHHLSSCEFCSDEYKSLQIVKRLLGSLDTVDAKSEWSSTVTTHAYAGGRPWWEKTISNEWLSIQLVRPIHTAELSPRGTRMARALALSAVFIFLAAVPVSIEHLEGGVTGRMDASLSPSFLPFSINQRSNTQTIGSIFHSANESPYMNVDTGMVNSGPHFDVVSASAMPQLMQPAFQPDNSFILASTAQK